MRRNGQHHAPRRGRGRGPQAPDDLTYAGPGSPEGNNMNYGGPRSPEDNRNWFAPGSPDDTLTWADRRSAGDGPAAPEPDPAPRRRWRSRGRVRRLFRRPTVRVIAAIIVVFFCWVAFSVGHALTAPGGGSVSSKLAEWARDHYLGPVVTFAEWMTYNPPKVGGKPSFSLAVPSGEAVKHKYGKAHGFKPIIPAQLTPLAGTALPGEGVWRVIESVRGEPALFSTFLRPSAEYSSYVAGIVSIDQRLVTFQLHPGSEDPGPGNWGSQPWIPPGSRRGLLATFNGGFKLDTAGGGFYLNGVTRGTMTKGAASVVYYRNGTIAIGTWGSELRMTSDVVGVRQNLKLIVDHGQVPNSVNYNVITSWGATLGGGYYVWRSGLGITADGRVIYVYGPAMNVRELADILQQAGAVEALQLDINPFWMSFMYYEKDGHPSDPTPVNLLTAQQQTAYRYYSIYSRDFTSVYARKTSLPRG